MIITKLTLNNFGPFRGAQHFDLKPRQGGARPIVLFGGKNGAGKTTIFEAIRVCLYGLNALPGRQRRADYEQFLLDRIHRHKSLPVQSAQASVEIEFEYAHLGKVSKYVVRRMWERKGNGAGEELAIFRDGRSLEDVDADQWQDFIKELIPPGLSQLFFFDGEKIEQLAAHGSDAEQFRDAFRSLLGLDLIERLQDDLTIHIARHQKEANAEDIQRRLKIAQEELANHRAQQVEKTRERAQLQNVIYQLRSAIEKQEAKLSSEGGGFASRRSSLKAKAARIDEQIREIEAQIRDMASGLLPLAFSPEYLTRLENRLLEETEIARFQSAREIVSERQERLRRKARNPNFWKDIVKGDEARKAAAKRVSQLLGELLPTSLDSGEIIHPCSELERAKLLTWIRAAKTAVPAELAQHSRKLEKLHQDRRQIEKTLRRVPQEEILAPLLERLKELNKELGAAEMRLKHCDQELSLIEFRIKSAEREAADIVGELQQADGLSKRIETALKTRTVLEKYLERITQVKLRELSEELAVAFSSLSNKEGYYARVEIDSKTFESTLFTKYGDVVTREQLSAGERQIFATSLLWALAKTSRRPLPFIIDTPLGRLDHSHRKNLVENFFPRASHQVIILSTDAEIEGRYHKMLDPFVSHSYTLRYDPAEGETTYEESYGFRASSVEVAA